MKTCAGNLSTFGKSELHNTSCHHGARAIQRSHHGGHLESLGHLTIGAPEGPYTGRRMRRNIFSNALLNII